MGYKKKRSAKGSVSGSSGVYICNSIVNDLRHGNFICKSEDIHLPAGVYLHDSIRCTSRTALPLSSVCMEEPPGSVTELLHERWSAVTNEESRPASSW